MGLSKPH